MIDTIQSDAAIQPGHRDRALVRCGEPRRVYQADGDAIAAHIPTVVLVVHGTVSAVESVTAALQDHGRGGHAYLRQGTFRLTWSLINDGDLDMTIGEFFTPDGQSLRGAGPGPRITPDIDAVGDPHAPRDEVLAVGERTVAVEVR